MFASECGVAVVWYHHMVHIRIYHSVVGAHLLFFVQTCEAACKSKVTFSNSLENEISTGTFAALHGHLTMSFVLLLFPTAV